MIINNTETNNIVIDLNGQAKYLKTEKCVCKVWMDESKWIVYDIFYSQKSISDCENTNSLITVKDGVIRCQDEEKYLLLVCKNGILSTLKSKKIQNNNNFNI